MMTVCMEDEGFNSGEGYRSTTAAVAGLGVELDLLFSGYRDGHEENYTT